MVVNHVSSWWMWGAWAAGWAAAEWFAGAGFYKKWWFWALVVGYLGAVWCLAPAFF
jgi:hypothetical protein